MKKQKAKSKRQNYSSIFFIFLLSTFYFLFSARYAKAQTFSLSITPPLLEVMIKPGKSITQTYKLQNLGDDAQIWTDAVPFTPLEDGQVKLDLQHPTSSLLHPPYLNWFSFQNTDHSLSGSFRLLPGETQELTLQIQVPEDAPEADYYAALTFQVKPGNNMVGPNLTKTSGIIATNILLTVSKTGLPTRTGKISQFKIKKGLCLFDHCFPVFDSFESINFNLKVENQNPILFKAGGKIKILNISGKEVDSIDVPPQNILANSAKKILCQQGERLRECQFQSKFLVGKFKTQANLEILENNKLLEDQIYFFIFPWKFSLGIIAGILIFVIIKKILKF